MGEIERETMELDAVFVGAGPANLCAAYRLMTGVAAHNEKAAAEGKPPIEEPTVLVIEKGAKVGNHNLSGAVVDPIAFKEIFPDFPTISGTGNELPSVGKSRGSDGGGNSYPVPEIGSEWPFLAPVTEEGVYYLTKTRKIAVPGSLLPKEMHNGSGYYLASIGELCRWLAAKCEEVGVEIYTEFAATELIREGAKVLGVRIGDKGLDKDGNPTESFAPGMDLLAKVTVLGEGTRGYLSQQLIADRSLDADSNCQNWGLGIKERIEIPKGRVRKGQVIHTFGYPLDSKTYGGSFLYGVADDQVALGLVFGLDYPNALLNSHETFLAFKKHPFIASIVAGGKVLEYGAKTLPEGGWFALPRLAVDGAVLVGDSAGLLNCMRQKGIHLAMKSGALAADRILEAMRKDDFSSAALDYRPDLDASWAGEELRRARNFRQGYHGGLIAGMIGTGLHVMTGGALPGGRKTMPPDHEGLRKAAACVESPKVPTDDTLYLDILTDIYKSGALHNERQPCHCKILDNEACKRCRADYAMPCTRFCPAKVYEESLDESGNFLGIRVNFSNCVHCKTCEIKNPLRNIRWTPPEGGDGPKYQRM